MSTFTESVVEDAALPDWRTLDTRYCTAPTSRRALSGATRTIATWRWSTACGRMVAPKLARVIANIHGSRTLAALRDTLLPKLISGELRVKDAARFVDSVDTGGRDQP